MAPLGAFGAMAFTVGKYGAVILFGLGKVLLCVYGSCFVFVFGVLWLICFWRGVSLFKTYELST